MNKSPRSRIARLGFSPPGGHGFDMEVLSASAWLERVPVAHFNYPSRLDFHQIILVTRGRFVHTVDFQLEATRAGALLVMRPGQVQRFEARKPWDGWVVIFRPEAFQSAAGPGSPNTGLSVEDIPVQVRPDKPGFEAALATLMQMHLDAASGAGIALLRALERAQLQSLLIRLQLASLDRTAPLVVDSTLARHFRKFRQEAEHQFHEWHQVSTYARALGISEKTLNRATREVAGLSAKAYLSRRIALEAKRLLAHTSWPISVVADKLGFDEATNFVKFFRREAGFAPSEFRQQQRGKSP